MSRLPGDDITNPEVDVPGPTPEDTFAPEPSPKEPDPNLPSLDEEVDEDFFKGFDKETKEAPVAEAEPKPPEPPPAAEPPAPEPKAPEPTAPVVEPPTSAAPTTEVSLEEARTKFISELAETTYKMSQDEAEKMSVDPAAVLPSLAARVHANVYRDLYHTLAGQLPVLVDAITRGQARANETMSAFYSEYPELKDAPGEAKKAQVITEIARVYASMNPNATTEQRRAFVGQLAMQQLGIARSTTPQPQTVTVRVPPQRTVAAGVTAPAAPQAPPPSLWDELVTADT